MLVRGTVAFAITIFSRLLHITSCQCFVWVTYRPAFVISWSVVRALSQRSLLSQYRVSLLRFCVLITINRKTALLLFVVRFPHAGFSAGVCLCDSHVCFCGCMCIDVYEFPLKRTREEVVEHSFFRCFLPSSFQEERTNFFPSSFLPSSSISCRRNDVRNLSTINDVLLLLAPPSAAQQQKLQKKWCYTKFMLGMNAARFCS